MKNEANDLEDKILGFYDPYSLITVLKKLKWATEYLLHIKNYDGHCYEELCQSVRRAGEIISNFENYPEIKKTSIIQESKPLVVALQHFVHLHLCEQEGLSSGQPTPQQWMEAVDKACEVLQPYGLNENVEK